MLLAHHTGVWEDVFRWVRTVICTVRRRVSTHVLHIESVIHN